MHFLPAAHVDIFLQMAQQKEGEQERWLVTKDRHVWSLSLPSRNTGLLAPLTWAGGFAGQGRAWDFKYCGEGLSTGRKGSQVLDSLNLLYNQLFTLLWVGQSIFCVFFLFGIISHSLSRDDLFLNLLLERSSLIWKCLHWAFKKVEAGFVDNKWVERAWSL